MWCRCWISNVEQIGNSDIIKENFIVAKITIDYNSKETGIPAHYNHDTCIPHFSGHVILISKLIHINQMGREVLNSRHHGWFWGGGGGGVHSLLLTTKTSKLHITGFMRGNPLVTKAFPHTRPVIMMTLTCYDAIVHLKCSCSYTILLIHIIPMPAVLMRDIQLYYSNTTLPTESNVCVPSQLYQYPVAQANSYSIKTNGNTFRNHRN